MKKLMALIVATLLIIALAGCGAPAKKHSYKSLKCPACGQVFDVPAN